MGSSKPLKGTENIEMLQYRSIHGWFEVCATTSLEFAVVGKMNGALLKEFIKMVKQSGGKVKKVKGPLINTELLSEIKHLKAELKISDSKLKRIEKILL